ncbi:MAG: GTP cyclohydrolase II [Anaerolineales bacterium]|nr:GTP cyclohydrolase II [Anaerolineales bacterium]
MPPFINDEGFCQNYPKPSNIERMMQPIISKTSARIPTADGAFTLSLYQTHVDDKEHLALVVGNVAQHENVLVRIHSECFTGDVLGSLRCDCGPQLNQAMKLIASEGVGVILYLRQEGRGIGLQNKLRAYNLQDEGYDTVDANLLLGHQADERDYSVAALMLDDLGVQSLRLLTNNPAKIEGLVAAGLRVTDRVPLQVASHDENAAYLETKVKRMRHLLDLERVVAGKNGRFPRHSLLSHLQPGHHPDRAFVTLSYAQSLDGSITVQRGQPTAISGIESMQLTHHLRASHDAILVGIGTVLADNPSLTVRLVAGQDPRPVILDSQLRCPPDVKFMARHPVIAALPTAPTERQVTLEAAGAEVWRLPANAAGRVALLPLLVRLKAAGLDSVMVEGGSQVISSFLTAGLPDRVMVTVAPLYLGGLTAVESQITAGNGRFFPQLTNHQYHQVGKDLVVVADVVNER